MNQQEAFSILSVAGRLSNENIKKAYRKLAMKNHPDRNPEGLEMMKLINVAYETVKDFGMDYAYFDKQCKDYFSKFLVTDVETVEEFIKKYYKFADDKELFDLVMFDAKECIEEIGIADLLAADSVTGNTVAFKPA